ncbi:unnamed protein product [Cladocopium goreaui]|uniref:Tankyrase-1 n=1 Tax=Cladocopium goreaui TaxID=2562237 RepID=A0A9P1GI31_9DINO|nr:unnamed protein product [Cladocopium goreaui]
MKGAPWRSGAGHRAQASTKRGGRGGVAPHQLSHGVDIWAILSNDEVPQSVTCCVPMPLPSCKSVTCLQAFVSANLLDMSSDGGGVMPTPECRTCRDDDLHQVIEPFSGGSQVGAMPQDSCGLEFPIFTCLSLDVAHECVLAFHKTFGGTLMALCTFGPAVIARKRNMCIGDVIAFLQIEFDQRPFHCTDLLGFALDRGDPCPDAVMVLSVSEVSPADFSRFLTLDVCSDMRVTSFEGWFDDLGPFVELLRSTGLLDLMLCLGLSCLIPVPCCICSHPRFDSVMAGLNIDLRERYREFVVYDKQCYPEFMVTYERCLKPIAPRGRPSRR